MKKVGLVSVRNYNYGSILQAYALQQELFAAGIDNELIYYKKRNVVKQALRIFNLPLLMAKTKDVWRVIEGKTNPKLKPIISGRNRAFSNFLKDNFVFTPCLSGKKQLVDYTKKFDAFILGSDQVWNPMLLGGDYYTLTWVDKQKTNNPVNHSIIIEDDVWIGYDALIMPGVTIGKGSVIGARAIVTKDVPPYSIYVGNKVIKKRFSEDIINKLSTIDFSKVEHTSVDTYMNYCQTEITSSNVDDILDCFVTRK